MNLVDSLNNNEQHHQLRLNISTDDSSTYDWNMATVPSIISNNISTGSLRINDLAIETTRTSVNLSDETINEIAERVYNLIRQRGIE